MTVEMSDFSRVFKALGDPTRLRIYDMVRGCCCGMAVDDDGGVIAASGPTAGEVCCSVTGAQTITSTVSHHIKELKEAGLITVERRGKHMVLGFRQDTFDQLAAYFGGSTAAPAAGCCS